MLLKHVLNVVLDVGVPAQCVDWHIGHWLLLHELSDRCGLLDGDLTLGLHLGAMDDLAPVLRPRWHHSARMLPLPLTVLTGHHDLLGRSVPLDRLTPGVLDMLLLVSLLDDALVLETDLTLAHHRPLDLARPHLHVSDVGLGLDRTLGPQ